MDLQRLRSFVAVAETGALSRAAEKVGLVQSALSHQMQALERDLGTELFERRGKKGTRGRRLKLSPVGFVLLEEAHRILDQVARARDRVQRAVEGRIGVLRIGFQTPTYRNPLVSESFYRFRTQMDGVDLLLAPMTLADQVDGLRSGAIDAGFLYLPFELTDFHQITIEMTDWLLVLPRHHMLARKRSIKLIDLQNEDFIWLPPKLAPLLTNEIITRCRAGGLVPRITQQASEEPMMLNLVSVGLGVTFVLANIRNHSREDVVLKEITDFSLPMAHALIWSKENQSPTLSRFVDIVRKLRKVSRKT